MKAYFIKNGLPYTLIKQNSLVCLYGIGGTYTDEIICYEVLRIQVRNDKYGVRDALPSNEQFGKDGSASFISIKRAEKYYTLLTDALLSSSGHKNPYKGNGRNKKAGKDMLPINYIDLLKESKLNL